MKTPLLRLEIRQHHIRRRRFYLALLVPTLVVSGLFTGSIAAQAGLINTAILSASCAAIGWLLHKASYPIL